MIVYLFGKPNVGKTTISKELIKELNQIDLKPILIDAGNLRKTLNKYLGFSREDRIENHRRTFTIANELSNQGFLVILNSINPYEEFRKELYSLLDDPFIIYLDCPLEELIKRDTKGLYSNNTSNLTGVSDPFDEPTLYDLKLDTSKESLEECTNKILELIIPKIPTKVDDPSAMFIGRWEPFHKGHEWLIQQRLNEGKKILIGIRNMPTSESNPLTAYQTAYCIKKVFPQDDVQVKVIPDIESFNYGRKVGYKVTEYIPEESIGQISGTEVRNSIKDLSDTWVENTNECLHGILKNWIK